MPSSLKGSRRKSRAPSSSTSRSPSPLAKSIDICRENLRQILEQPYASHIRFGVNVESVSINRDEIDASIELFHALSEVVRGR